MKIGKVFTFEAAHDLPLHDGKCRGLHGHSYRVEVVIQGEQIGSGPKSGMVLDFADLKAVWRTKVHDRVDHKYLNDVIPTVTTAENIAWWIFREINEEIPQVKSVKVWETATSWAEATA